MYMETKLYAKKYLACIGIKQADHVLYKFSCLTISVLNI